MRVLVCGGRDFANQRFLYQILDTFKEQLPITSLLHGGAAGADALAGIWARDRGIPLEVFPADWKQHGRRAGFLRNTQMLVEGAPDAVIAFDGGKGTQMMLRIAMDANLPIYHYKTGAM